MATAQELLKVYEDQLYAKEQELLAQRKDVWTFVASEHKAQDTLEAKTLVSNSEAELTDILKSLISAKDVLSEYKTEADKLCQHCRELNAYTRDMQQALSVDLVERRRIEDAEKKDAIKEATFIVAIPAALVAMVKAGAIHIDIEKAAETGLVFSTTFVFRKQLKKAFHNTQKSISSKAMNVLKTARTRMKAKIEERKNRDYVQRLGL